MRMGEYNSAEKERNDLSHMLQKTLPRKPHGIHCDTKECYHSSSQELQISTQGAEKSTPANWYVQATASSCYSRARMKLRRTGPCVYFAQHFQKINSFTSLKWLSLKVTIGQQMCLYIFIFFEMLSFHKVLLLRVITKLKNLVYSMF